MSSISVSDGLNKPFYCLRISTAASGPYFLLAASSTKALSPWPSPVRHTLVRVLRSCPIPKG